MLGDPAMISETRASLAGSIDRPIRRSARGRARPTAVTARSTPINRAAMASASAHPASWCSRSPAEASPTPTSAAVSSTTTARSVGSLVSRRKAIGDSPHAAASRLVCARLCRSDMPSAANATARTTQPTANRSTAEPTKSS
jgi:hypothetical protein